MKTVTSLNQLPDNQHLAVIIFPVKPTGKVEYTTFKDQADMEAWASAELSKKNSQRQFRILDAKPQTLQVRVNGAVIATLAAETKA